MPGTAGPNLGLVTGYSAHENGWGVGGFTPNFDLLDALVFLSVTNATTTAPPGSPAAGDRYIVAAGATGSWATHDDDLAIYRGGTWHFYTPKSGWRAFNVGTGTYVRFNGTAWVTDSGAGLNFVDLGDVNLTSLADNDFIAYNNGTSKWTNRTPAAATALLSAVVGDSGSGGTKGLVPAPAAGDTAAGKFLKADGTFAVPPGTGGSLTLISTQTASASASLTWTGLAAATSWKLVGKLLVPATNATGLLLQIGTGAGPTWKTAGYDFGEYWMKASNSASGFGATNQGGHPFDDGALANSDPGVSFEVLITTDNATFVLFNGTSIAKTTTTSLAMFSGTTAAIAAAITGFRLIMGTGNITSGSASLYGFGV